MFSRGMNSYVPILFYYAADGKQKGQSHPVTTRKVSTMKRAAVADATLRMNSGFAQGFKEKIEIVKQLDRLSVDVIETAPLLNGKSDVLFLHTIIIT